MNQKFITMSCSGISIGLPVKKDVNTPFLVIGAEGSGPESDTAFLSLSLRSTDFFSKLSSKIIRSLYPYMYCQVLCFRKRNTSF